MKKNSLYTAILIICTTILPFTGWSQYVWKGISTNVGSGYYQLTPYSEEADLVCIFLEYKGNNNYLDGADSFDFQLTSKKIAGFGNNKAINSSVAENMRKLAFETYTLGLVKPDEETGVPDEVDTKAIFFQFMSNTKRGSN